MKTIKQMNKEAQMSAVEKVTQEFEARSQRLKDGRIDSTVAINQLAKERMMRHPFRANAIAEVWEVQLVNASRMWDVYQRELLAWYEKSLADAIDADSLAEDSAVEEMVMERDGVSL
jgi:hypothetical protein